MDSITDNKEVRTDVAIIGAGLTGLTLHYYLREQGVRCILIEGRNRIGGRILTVREPGQAAVEMGATWFGTKHENLTGLLKKLKLGSFPQELGATAIYEYMSTAPPQLVTLPENEEPSYRLIGGTGRLIEALAAALDEVSLYTERTVQGIREREGGLQIITDKESFFARKVVTTLPPNLLLNTIEIEPDLPGSLKSLMGKTHTWMGESIKFGLIYEHPFWREEGKSGTLFSNTGPVTEMYDHSDYEEKHFALKGFLNGVYHSLSRQERLDLILNQLRKYYGTQANSYSEYLEYVWVQDKFTYAPYARQVLPHQNNGHVDYRQPLLDGKLFLAGSETAPHFPGYMDGAVESANRVFRQLTDAGI